MNFEQTLQLIGCVSVFIWIAIRLHNMSEFISSHYFGPIQRLVNKLQKIALWIHTNLYRCDGIQVVYSVIVVVLKDFLFEK